MSKNRFKIKKRCNVQGCNKLVTAEDYGVCKNHICRCGLSCCKIHIKKIKKKTDTAETASLEGIE